VEVILATALFGTLVAALAGVFVYGQVSSVTAANRARAFFLADEGLEAARSLAPAQWQVLADGTYGVSVSQGGWELSGAPDSTGIFTREISITSVGPISKDVTSRVQWHDISSRDSEATLYTRITQWQ